MIKHLLPYFLGGCVVGWLTGRALVRRNIRWRIR
jgi:hypothetical protein